MQMNSHIALLKGLLEQYSPTLQEAPAVQYLAGQMQSLGYAVTVDAVGSVIGILGDGPREIVLLGHIDTVPGVVPVRQEDNRLYGRGSVDAKGPLACFTAAAALAGAQHGWRLTVIGAVGEEGDSRGAQYVRDSYLAARLPDFCIIGEPSSWDHITLGYKGSAWLQYTIRRALAHTASAQQSVCESAVSFWNAIQAEADRYNQAYPRVFDQLSPSLRAMHSTQNGLYEEAVLEINLRLPPGLRVAQAGQLFSCHAGEGQIHVRDGIECYRAEKNTALVRALLAAIRVAGGQPGFLVKTGTADMNIVGPAWNCPILAYGPGDSALDHTPNEHIQIEEYLSAIHILADTLHRLQSETNPPSRD